MLGAGWRWYWLANRGDGLYPGGDAYVVRHPAAASAEIGHQVYFATGYTPSRRCRVHAGYGHWLTGPYLRQAGYHSMLRTVYLQTSFLF